VTWLQVSDATGDVSFEKVPLDARSSDDAFVLDIGTDVFVWVGKDASKQEHMMGMVHAQKYLKENNRPPHVPLHCMTEGNESELFKSVACV